MDAETGGMMESRARGMGRETGNLDESHIQRTARTEVDTLSTDGIDGVAAM